MLCFLLGLSLFQAGCMPRGSDQAAMYASPPVAILARVDFATLRSELLSGQCLQCHSEFDTEAGLMSYVVAGDPEHSSLYQSIITGSMPPGGPQLPAASAELVSTYIQGLKTVK
jgi:hypothetical protein